MDDMIYKNTEMLLKRYRDVVWSIEVSKLHLNTNNNTKLDEFLELSYAAGADLTNTNIAEQEKTIEKNKKMLSLIDRGLDLIRRKQKYGEEYYKIIYYTYITDETLNGCNDILDKLEDEGCFMSEKSYYRKKSNAIKLLGEILFGCSEYVIKDVFELLQ